MSARPVRYLACVASLLVATLFATAGAATADEVTTDTESDVRAAYDEAIDSTLQELAYMQLSGAFGPDVPIVVERLPEILGIGSAEASDVTAALTDVNERRGPAALDALARLGRPLDPPVVAVLGSSPVDSPIGVGYAPYVRAHHELVVDRLALDGLSLTPEADSTGLLGVFRMLPVAGEVLGGVLVRSELPEVPIDRGDPPEVLIQGDDPRPTETPATSPSTAATPAGIGSALSLDPIELLIIAAVAVIVLGLITMLVTSGQRHGRTRDHDGLRSNGQIMEATRAIHAANTMKELCDAAARHARLLTDARSATITIDGLESTDGPHVDVPVELVFEANRRAMLVSEGSLHAIPIDGKDGDVVGLLVVDGGDRRRLEAFEPLVEDGYASVASRAETAALAYVDSLTGIANRRRFDKDLDTIVGVAAESDTPVAAAMFDVDDFKTFNDTNGHQAGDEVLRQVAELISNNLRSTDIVYRYGGEEFVALLPGADVADAFEVVDRIRQIVECAAFEGQACQPGGTVTLSVGVAAAPQGDGRSLVRAADMALYEAKTTGRNRVVAESSLG